MQAGKKNLIAAIFALLIFSAGVTGGYIYFTDRFASVQIRQAASQPWQPEKQDGDFSFIRVYYPSGGRLVMEERRVQRKFSLISVAEAAAEEFLKGPVTAAMTNTGKSDIPEGTRLLGIYQGSDGIVYVNLSDEFRRNFQGDALTEFLLLKGMYESIISNVQGADNVKLIVEGKEIESIGGHIYSMYPLKDVVQEVR